MWKKVSAGLAAIVLIGSALAVVKEYRFWATKEEMYQVAEVSYSTALARQRDYLVQIELLLAECDSGTCSAARIANLKQQKARIEAEIQRLQKDEAKLR